MYSLKSDFVFEIFDYFNSIPRYLDLTEEEKEKLKGSYKVAKKLEKLENIGQDR